MATGKPDLFRQRRRMGLPVGVRYGGDLVGPKAATVAVKALQEPVKDGRTG
jgi:hypothetical protein